MTTTTTLIYKRTSLDDVSCIFNCFDSRFSQSEILTSRPSFLFTTSGVEILSGIYNHLVIFSHTNLNVLRQSCSTMNDPGNKLKLSTSLGILFMYFSTLRDYELLIFISDRHVNKKIIDDSDIYILSFLCPVISYVSSKLEIISMITCDITCNLRVAIRARQCFHTVQYDRTQERFNKKRFKTTSPTLSARLPVPRAHILND